MTPAPLPPASRSNGQKRQGGGLSFTRWTAIRILVEIFVVGLIILLAVTAKEFADQRGLSNGYLAAKFFISPGFAGCLAVVAAAIGFVAVRSQLQHNRLELAHEQQAEANRTWWATFQWVADKALAAQNDIEAMPATFAASMLLDLSKDELGTTSSSSELPALWESRQRACNGLALALSSRVDPSTPMGQEVLDSLTKLAGLTEDSYAASPALNSQLERLSTKRGMFQKLSVVGREHGMEVITDPAEIMERLGLDGPFLRVEADALVMKKDKYVWVHLISSSTSSGRYLNLKRGISRDVPQVGELAGAPYLFVLRESPSQDALARIGIPDHVHIADENGTNSLSMKVKLLELLA